MDLSTKTLAPRDLNTEVINYAKEIYNSTNSVTNPGISFDIMFT